MYAAWGGTSMRSWCSGVINREEGRSKVGEIDGTPVFDSPEAALKHAESIGCSGFHEHELEGEKVYMACSTHADAQGDERSEITGAVKKGLKRRLTSITKRSPLLIRRQMSEHFLLYSVGA